MSYQPKIFWGQTGKLKTTFEEKMKRIGGLKKCLGPYEKKVWTKKSLKKQDREFFELEISITVGVELLPPRSLRDTSRTGVPVYENSFTRKFFSQGWNYGGEVAQHPR